MNQEKVREFYRIYYDNEKRIRKLDNLLFESSVTPDEWVERLTERSKVIREAYEQNMQELNAAIMPVIRDYHCLTMEDAEFLNQIIDEQKIYTRRDFMLNRPVLESLVRFYEENDQSLWVQKTYNLLQNCFVLALIETEYREEFIFTKKVMEALSREAMYEQKLQASALRVKYNSFTIHCVLATVPYEDILAEGETILRFLQREDVAEASKDYKTLKINDYAYFIKMNLVEAYYGKPVPCQETIARIREYVKQLIQDKQGSEDGSLFVYSKYWEYMSGMITGNQYFEAIYRIFFSEMETCSYYETISTIEDAGKMPCSFYIAADVAQAVRYTDYSDEKKAALYAKIIDHFLQDINMAKKGSFDMMLANYIQRLLYSLDAYCGPKEILLNAIVNISIRQQIQTYLHSVMVQKIVCMVVDHILLNEPEKLIGFRGYRTAAEVLSNQEQIREYVRYASLLHDVGKIYIPEIINLQCRKLTEQEFREIQKHPVYGDRLLTRFPCLAEYKDIVLGHHKYYDDTKGYPESFHTLSSPYKIVIDLISIADSADAATDILGRNYTKGKTFEQTLTEFREGAGTRYSPVFVDYIDRHADLRKSLSLLVGKNRTEIYYELYNNIINPQK